MLNQYDVNALSKEWEIFKRFHIQEVRTRFSAARKTKKKRCGAGFVDFRAVPGKIEIRTFRNPKPEFCCMRAGPWCSRSNAPPGEPPSVIHRRYFQPSKPISAAMAEKVSTRELGLILGARLMKTDDLHYGYWPDGLEVKLANLPDAQSHYTEFLKSLIPYGASTILDVGCGTGHFAQLLSQGGYAVDCISPSPILTRMARERLGGDFPIYETTYEAFETGNRYDLILFSESFQYIPIRESLPKSLGLLNPGGHLLIADFFRTNAPGESALRGGHDLAGFYAYLETLPWRTVADEDITRFTAPNLNLMDELLTDYMQPVWDSLGYYLSNNHPWLTWLGRRFFGKKLDKIRFKYLSHARNAENFGLYKSYRCLLLQKVGEGTGTVEG